MYAPGYSYFREASEDYKIPGTKHVIKKGSRVMIPVVGFHYDSRYWKNPEVFDPDHFKPEEIENRPRHAFIPFGDGPRVCTILVLFLFYNFNIIIYF